MSMFSSKLADGAVASSAPPEHAIPRSALTHLDFLRGTAALLVLISHLRGLFFTDWDRVVAPSLPMKVLYFWTGLGHESVIVFFVLSGFFIGHSVITAHRAGNWHWGHYAVRRLSRLYVVLVPGLLLTALLDVGGMHLFGSKSGIYAGEIDAPFLHLANANETVGLGTFVSNLLFLQGVSSHEYGTNGPLWSLPYEFWYYVVFPMFVRALAVSVGLFWRVVLVAVAAGLLAIGGRTAVFYLLIWGMGAFVAYAWQVASQWLRDRAGGRTTLQSASILGLALVVFLVTVAISRLRILSRGYENDFVLGIGTTMLVWVVVTTSGKRPHLSRRIVEAYSRLSTFLARFSFTLYVAHFPLLVFIFALFDMKKRWQPDAVHLSYGALLLAAVVLLYAYPLSELTEAHTDSVRRWVERSLPFLRDGRVRAVTASNRRANGG
jgi:peptidoglycan/LPS O-acetylase OafA/YrhL